MALLTDEERELIYEEGYDAGLEGKQSQDNPYTGFFFKSPTDKDKLSARIWRRGWNDGREERRSNK